MIADLKISSKNLLDWSHMEDWDAGASAAPTGYTLSGASASVARESSIVKSGTYSAALTRSGADCKIYNDHADYADYAGRKVTYGKWVYATVADRARIAINDGVGSTESSYHSGVAGWEWLTVTRNIDVDATQLRTEDQINTGDTTAYFDGGVLCEGALIFLDLSTILEDWDISKSYRYSKYTVARRQGVNIPDVEHGTLSLVLKGKVWGTTATAARTSFDSLLQYFNEGEKDIYLYDDRFFRGVLVSENHTYIAALKVIEFTLKLEIAKPWANYIQKTRNKQTITSSPTAFTVTNSGNTPVKPKITFLASGNDITSCVIENLTTGQKISFSATVTDGDELVIDCEEVTVENDGVDSISSFAGDFLEINPGDNAFKFTGSNCIIKIDYYNRFL